MPIQEKSPQKHILFYNTLSRRLEPFKPVKKNLVRVYSCGPTVYNFAHIGNLRAYIFTDILVRSLSYLGHPVRHAMNITDVGHLTSDADDGEDKMDVAARREKKDPLYIAREYEKAFFADTQKLNILKPKKIKRATETIRQQQALIRLLEKQGYTYKTDAAIYFNTSKFKTYGALSGQKLEQKKMLSRTELVEDPQKRRPQDFALWIFTVGTHAHHILHWPSPWGVGFPGWHIECSAISRALLGQPFDIHTGGVDHIGVHHENEIAQSVAAFHTPLARIWMHNEHLSVDGKKMGKSIGNVYTLASITDKKIDPLSFRYFCLQAQYRSPLNFTWDGLLAAQTALRGLREFIGTVYIGTTVKTNKKYAKGAASRYIKEFAGALSDDLNTPRALAVAWGMIKDVHIPLLDRQRLLLQFDAVLGLGLMAHKAKPIPAKIRLLVSQRNTARSTAQFIQADVLRKKIQGLGYGVDDSPHGTYLMRISKS